MQYLRPQHKLVTTIPAKNTIIKQGNIHTITSTAMQPISTPITAVPSTQAPIVYYTAEALNTIKYLVKKVTTEVGWLGLVEKHDNYYLITEIFIPAQVVTAVTTEIEPEALVAITMQLLTEGKDPSLLRYWGHSHVNMSCHPSPVDEDQVEEYLDHADWFIRGIYNKRGESKVDVYDIPNNVIHQCVTNTLLPVQIPKEQTDTIDALIKANVTIKPFPRKTGKKKHQNNPYNPCIEDNFLDYFPSTNMENTLTPKERTAVFAFLNEVDTGRKLTELEIQSALLNDPFWVGE